MQIKQEHYFSYLNYPLKVVYIEEKPWFDVKDLVHILDCLDETYIIDILEIEEIKDFYVSLHLSKEFVSIQGVYRLLFDDFEYSHDFRHWFNDNLPAICFHGIVNKPEKDIFKARHIEDSRYDSLDARVNAIFDKLLPALKDIETLSKDVKILRDDLAILTIVKP
jgi:prophage antirepressor-like protein